MQQYPLRQYVRASDPGQSRLLHSLHRGICAVVTIFRKNSKWFSLVIVWSGNSVLAGTSIPVQHLTEYMDLYLLFRYRREHYFSRTATECPILFSRREIYYLKRNEKTKILELGHQEYMNFRQRDELLFCQYVTCRLWFIMHYQKLCQWTHTLRSTSFIMH